MSTCGIDGETYWWSGLVGGGGGGGKGGKGTPSLSGSATKLIILSSVRVIVCGVFKSEQAPPNTS